MPRTLKRRSDQISRDDRPDPPTPVESQSEDEQQRPTQHAESLSDEADLSDTSDAGQSSTTLQVLSKKLVRYALSTSYARLPIRRAEISKLLKDPGGSTARHPFKTVFNAAQEILRSVFGMELVDLPARERTTLNERRKAASQRAAAATQTSTQQMRGRGGRGADDGESQRRNGEDALASAQAWILVSTLPAAYRKVPGLLGPSRAPSADAEAVYSALCTFIVALIYLHPADGLPDTKLERFLRRVGVDSWVPLGEGMTLEKVLQRMVREGYVERIRDVSSGEESVEWVVGGRGRREVGEMGVAGLVREVYGFGMGDTEQQVDEDEEEQEQRTVEMEREELERRLIRSLGEGVKVDVPQVDVQGDAEANVEDTGPRRSRRRQVDADDGDEDAG